MREWRSDRLWRERCTDGGWCRDSRTDGDRVDSGDGSDGRGNGTEVSVWKGAHVETKPNNRWELFLVFRTRSREPQISNSNTQWHVNLWYQQFYLHLDAVWLRIKSSQATAHWIVWWSNRNLNAHFVAWNLHRLSCRTVKKTFCSYWWLFWGFRVT